MTRQNATGKFLILQRVKFQNLIQDFSEELSDARIPANEHTEKAQ